MSNYLVHCNNCDKTIPVMDFDISLHNSGECTLSKQERRDEKIYFVTHFGAFFGSFIIAIYLLTLWFKA